MLDLALPNKYNNMTTVIKCGSCLYIFSLKKEEINASKDLKYPSILIAKNTDKKGCGEKTNKIIFIFMCQLAFLPFKSK